jgi:hypothetical protein
MEINSQHSEVLYNQIEEAYGKVMYTYTTQVIHAGQLRGRNTVLKWVQIILSAVSTGGFVATIVTRICSHK